MTSDLLVALCVLDAQLNPTWIHGFDDLSSAGGSPAASKAAARLSRLVTDAQFLDLASEAFARRSARRERIRLSGADAALLFDVTFAPMPELAGQPALNVCILDVTVQQQKLDILADMAERYRLVADCTVDWEYWVAPDGNIRWMSPTCDKVTGHAASVFLGEPRLLETIVHPDDRGAVGEHLRSDRQADTPDHIRFRIVRPDGEVRWIDHVCQGVYDESSIFAGRRVSNRDVTDAMLVQQALRDSETQFRLMFELATVGMALIDPVSRRLLRVNERLCRLLGYEAEELLRMNFYDLTHPEDRDQDLVTYRLAMEQEEGDYFTEKRYVRKDGDDVWALVNAAFIRDEAGQPLRAVAAMIDITDRRNAEAQARELAAVVECSSDFIGVSDLEGRGIYLNQAGQALVGLSGNGAVRDCTIEDFLFPEDLPFVRGTVLPALRGAGSWADEFRFRHFVTGESLDVFWTCLRIDDPATGRPLQLATVARDIRKEKAAEQALLEADRRKDEFLAMLGHELRNPMAPIRNAVEIIRAVGIGEDSRIAWAIQVLDRQTSHISRLLDDLLDVSRIVRGRIDLNRRPIQVRDVVQQALDGVQALMQQRRHRLLWDLPGARVMVDGDMVRLSQVLLNLLVNAANYTPEGGVVRVSSEVSGDQVSIHVQDTGQGMAPEQIEALFGFFTSGARSPDTPSGGLGLGLAIARRLTELHDGRLEAFSEGPGLGSEFVVRLPILKDVPEEIAQPEEHSARVAPDGAMRVLVVDDNPDVAGALSMLLDLLGYSVKTAASGLEALEIAREWRPRVALLDIGIPGMDGLELAGRLRDDFPDPKDLLLVALTGLGHEEARERSIMAGFDLHLVKPLEQKVLLELLDSLR